MQEVIHGDNIPGTDRSLLNRLLWPGLFLTAGIMFTESDREK